MAYDLLFSYWLLIWFVLYYFKIVLYNPKWVFIIAMIYILIAIIIMIYNKSPPFKIFIFFMIGIISKAFPFYLIRNDPTNMRDIIFGVIVFLVYYLWVYYKRGPNKFIEIYTVDVFKFKTPIMNIL